jgi:hypothetical protein
VGHHQVKHKKNNRENHKMQYVTYITFGRGERGETRSCFYNALGCVRLCRGDMDGYAICGLGRCVFRQYDDLCVERVFGRCLWAWEKEEESVGRSVLGVRHMSHVTSSLWSFLSAYESHVDIRVQFFVVCTCCTSLCSQDTCGVTRAVHLLLIA